MIGFSVTVTLLMVLWGCFLRKKERQHAFQRFMLGDDTKRDQRSSIQWLARLFPFAPARSLSLIISSFLLPLIVGTVFGWVKQDGVILIVGVIVSILMPWLSYGWRSYWWKRRCRIQMKEALRLLSTAIRSGTTFVVALQRTAAEIAYPLHPLFVQAEKEIRLGVPEGKAFQRLIEQTGVKEYSIVALLIEFTIHKGGRLAYVLDDIASYQEEEEELVADLRSETTSYRTSAYILPLLMIGLIVLFWSSISPLLVQSWFLFMFIGALGLISMGFLLTIRIVRKLDV